MGLKEESPRKPDTSLTSEFLCSAALSHSLKTADDHH
jgi:hypothetical protein